MFQEFDEDNPNGYQEIILRREDNSKNIFDEFLKTIKHSLSCNGKNKFIFKYLKIII